MSLTENTKLTKVKSIKSKKKQYEKYNGSIKQERQNLRYAKMKKSLNAPVKKKRLRKVSLNQVWDRRPTTVVKSEDESDSDEMENIPIGILPKRRKKN